MKPVERPDGATSGGRRTRGSSTCGSTSCRWSRPSRHRADRVVAGGGRVVPAALLRGIPVTSGPRLLAIAWAIHAHRLGDHADQSGRRLLLHLRGRVPRLRRAAAGGDRLAGADARRRSTRRRCGSALPAGAGCRCSRSRAVVGAHQHPLRRDARGRTAAARRAGEPSSEMARIAERERIGRDLHDLLGHTLSVIVLKSELAAQARRAGSAARRHRDPRRRADLARGARRGAQGGARLSIASGLRDEVAQRRARAGRRGHHARTSPSAGERCRPTRSARSPSRCARPSPTSSATRSATHCWIAVDRRRAAARARGARRRPRRPGAGGQRAVGHARAPARRWPARSSATASAARGSCMSLPRTRRSCVVIRVLIAEDQAMVLGALGALLDIESDLEVVGHGARRHGSRSSWRWRYSPTSSSPTSRCRG